jgi:hypothetical protein
MAVASLVLVSIFISLFVFQSLVRFCAGFYGHAGCGTHSPDSKYRIVTASCAQSSSYIDGLVTPASAGHVRMASNTALNRFHLQAWI